mgnify:CR=1 FL=1
MIGRNGIGKTTLMKCICGLCEADESEIYTENGNVSKLDYLTRNIYYISDEPVYYNDLTLYEHLWIVCKAEGYKKDIAAEKIQDLISKYKMSEYLHFYPPAMSKGTLQRMMLMIGFLKNTQNLLLDEPFNGLDEDTWLDVVRLIRVMAESRPVVLVTHIPEQVQALEAAVIHLGDAPQAGEWQTVDFL